MHNKEIQLSTNYSFTKASQQTIDKICAEVGCSLSDIPKILRDYKWKYLSELKVKKSHNIVPAILRNSLALLISWTDVTPTFKANYIALWTGSTTPQNTDVKLETETIRGEFSNRYASTNVAFLDKFWSTAEVGWTTINEAGVFVDWTASADTWFLMSRILMNETMSVTETLTINVSITIA